METTGTAITGETKKRKTIVLSVSVITRDLVLMILKKAEIEHETLAIDQDGKTILKVIYSENDKELMNDIIRLMDFFDEAIALFVPLLKTALSDLQKNSDMMLEGLSAKYQTTKFLALDKLSAQINKKQDHGND